MKIIGFKGEVLRWLSLGGTFDTNFFFTQNLTLHFVVQILTWTGIKFGPDPDFSEIQLRGIDHNFELKRSLLKIFDVLESYGPVLEVRAI